MSKKQVNGVTIECVQGNIAEQPDMDDIVNAAIAHLRMGGGVAGAIHRAAGPGLEEEGRRLGPIRPGQAVIAGAHNLPNRHVIHCLGPVYGRDKPEAELLAACYKNALHLADEKGLASIAFPAISTGAFGYPLADAARVALKTVAGEIPALSAITRIRFVLFGESDLNVYQQAIEELAGT
jgi:O-acetyl-ADP-ribose deacetylase (regulator of RNase III)